MTERIPGAKRGRPAMPKPPKQSRGRPAAALRDNPRRYDVARFDIADAWLKNILNNSDRQCAITVTVGGELDQSQGMRDRVVMDRLRKASDRLRKLAQRYSTPDDMKWRKAMNDAIAFTILTAADKPTTQFELGIIAGCILEFAASVGEEEWATRELLPLIGLRPPPNLPEGDLSTFIAAQIACVGWFSEIRQWMAALAAADVQAAE